MMYIIIIILPLIGSIVSGFFGRKVGVKGSQLITILSVMATTLIAVMVFWEIALNDSIISILTFRWIDTEWLYVFWAFNFDSLTSSMLIPVLIISFLVHFYSVGYMSHDPHNQRFFSYLSLFTFMMIILVTANNFLLMFVGWEGVGVCSYLLVNFWYTRIAANQSSMSAFLTNRVGDCFLTLGMFAILWTFGNLDYSTVFSLAPYINENAITIIGVCLLVGAMAKSSQIGLHVWLPLAMEGPTPVSALIHAATMVTAGVYLLMRSSPLIEYSSTILMLCLWVGSITTIFSSLIGLFQQDIKKVIAYSTMSQLGMMVIAIGLSSYSLALFHLINHAFYKGLLFLGAGSVIHAVADNQDFRKYGGLIKYLPLTYVVMLLASLSLVAFPFMTGYYSKDFILESAFGQSNYTSLSVYYIAIIGAVFTTLYSIKVLYMTFLAKPNGPLINYKRAHEGNIFMSLPLVILSVFSVYFGFISKDMFIGLGTDLFADNSIFIHPYHEFMLNTEFGVPKIFKLLPFILTLLLIASFTYIFEFTKIFVRLKSNYLGYNIYNFFSLRFLIEFIYNKFVVRSIFYMGGHTTKVLDKGSIEHIGPYGLGKLFFNLSKSLAKLDSGIVTSYALYIVIGLISYILIIYANDIDISLFFFTIYALPAIFMFSDDLLLFSSRKILTPNTVMVKSVQSYIMPGLGLAATAAVSYKLNPELTHPTPGFSLIQDAAGVFQNAANSANVASAVNAVNTANAVNAANAVDFPSIANAVIAASSADSSLVNDAAPSAETIASIGDTEQTSVPSQGAENQSSTISCNSLKQLTYLLDKFPEDATIKDLFVILSTEEGKNYLTDLFNTYIYNIHKLFLHDFFETVAKPLTETCTQPDLDTGIKTGIEAKDSKSLINLGRSVQTSLEIEYHRRSVQDIPQYILPIIESTWSFGEVGAEVGAEVGDSDMTDTVESPEVEDSDMTDTVESPEGSEDSVETVIHVGTSESGDTESTQNTQVVQGAQSTETETSQSQNQSSLDIDVGTQINWGNTGEAIFYIPSAFVRIVVSMIRLHYYLDYNSTILIIDNLEDFIRSIRDYIQTMTGLHLDLSNAVTNGLYFQMDEIIVRIIHILTLGIDTIRINRGFFMLELDRSGIPSLDFSLNVVIGQEPFSEHVRPEWIEAYRTLFRDSTLYLDSLLDDIPIPLETLTELNLNVLLSLETVVDILEVINLYIGGA